MKPLLYALSIAVLVVGSLNTHAQTVIPPGGLTIDGIPVSCGNTYTLLDPTLNDAGHWDGANYIRLNPAVFNTIPTTQIKLFIYAHECGHVMGNIREIDADCWAVRLGKAQGWFAAGDFYAMASVFANNPGDYTHPPGPQRIALMEQCFVNAPG